MRTVSEGVMPVHASHQSFWVVLSNESNCLLENLEMYQITVACSVKHFTRYIEGELHYMKSILCDTQLLTMHTLLAKCPTLNCDSRVRFGRASFS